MPQNNGDEYREDKNGIIRDRRGYFAPGQTGNPAGRPKREVEAEALTMLSEEITPQVWRAMVKRLAAKVLRDGDVSAFRAIADYYAGKPTERIEMAQEIEATDIILMFGKSEPDVEPFGHVEPIDNADA